MSELGEKVDCKKCDYQNNFEYCSEEHRNKWSNRGDCWLFHRPLKSLHN